MLQSECQQHPCLNFKIHFLFIFIAVIPNLFHTHKGVPKREMSFGDEKNFKFTMF